MKIFIAGPRKITKLNSKVILKLNNIIKNNFTILVGDANGIDKAIQNYVRDKDYKNVIVYASGKIIRNNIGNWQTRTIDVSKNIRGFDFYTVKDKEMAKDADYGLMVWNGKSKGTFNNILNLINLDKVVFLYLTINKEFYKISNANDVKKLMSLINNPEINSFFLNKVNKNEQIEIML
ncbi:MAG: hypothetical protein ACTHVE_09990 [Senegalia sp. (in: firmicutes)]|uniref:hypothetical protein n=1 Tax=Senegalia sp. (in: firmicutes) TaxID=1924098 RepID=UPI003F9742BD